MDQKMVVMLKKGKNWKIIIIKIKIVLEVKLYKVYSIEIYICYLCNLIELGKQQNLRSLTSQLQKTFSHCRYFIDIYTKLYQFLLNCVFL